MCGATACAAIWCCCAARCPRFCAAAVRIDARGHRSRADAAAAECDAVKILLCHNYYRSPGGADQSFAAQRRLLERHRHEVLVYTRHNEDVAAASHVDLAWRARWTPRRS